ncbi:hypothetical protein [Marinifilum caeruleilacunae]|uniref:O-antigen ligase domain-containing protein n=1 Tax=Marinifilum caeruleilacunae TaxID=2499076 RepID=A0ABX1WTH1_9BACT|nr:hypothetical protein [Marinifilum caeruleilacunae]NOU59224.1 hypothetical protein [Marinifilum caeruleilacunae]
MNRFFKIVFCGNSTLKNVLFGALYIFIFSYVWKYYCVTVWHAYFYLDVPHSFIYDCFGYAIALIPILFYKGIRNVSSWLSLILYYFGYVPIVLGLLFNFKEVNDYHVIEYWMVLCIAMSMYFYSDRIRIKIKHPSRKIPIKVIWFFAIIILLLQFAVYHNNMRIVSFTSVYQLRAENAEVGNAFMGYINSWSGSFIFPLIFVYGLFKKDKKFIVFGALSFLFLYSIFGAKSDFLAPLILFGFYKFFLWQYKMNINLLSILTISLGLLTLLLLCNLENEIVYVLAAVFLMRTMTISGILFVGYYMPFFQSHPYTFFSHVNIINAITNSNPYAGEAIGKVVTEGGMNANAVFWAMDGVTAMGVTGVAIVSFLFLLFLILINSLATAENRNFLCILFLIPMVALLNTSFFSFLLSEGVFLIILTILFVNLKYDKN